MIKVEIISDEEFNVTVSGNQTTQHLVSLTNSYYIKLCNNNITPKALIEISFEFLLERESNTSILRQFDLSVIGNYFPEYETTIQEKYLGSN